ncbi:UNVERIFIED_CONTAM: hypothetical protein Sradi_4558300 [Sesamum radiatum]|uniref:Uncharacterized protein n=1 Tax=Sesamum radiatum TaxID=300843 RepID=A0AAW2NA79_SESRA
MEGSENMDTAALQVRAPGKKDYLAKGGNQRRTYVDKRGQYCTNCDQVTRRTRVLSFMELLTGTRS